MSLPTREELLWRFGPVNDPTIEARRQRILDFLLETSPKTREQRLEMGRLIHARTTMRRALVRRQLTPSKDDDARIDACTDLATLERWEERATTAASASDVFQ